MRKLIFSITLALILGAAGWAEEAAREISIIARQFDFLPHKIEVVKGVPVRLYLTSLDVPHGIHIGEFEVSQKIEKGKLTVVDFIPDKAGRYEIHCSVYCGSGHRAMKGELVVFEPASSGPKMPQPMPKKHEDSGMHHRH